MLVLEGLQRTIQLQLLQHYWSGHYYDIEWFALETNILSFLRLGPSTEIRLLLTDGYSIPSK